MLHPIAEVKVKTELLPNINKDPIQAHLKKQFVGGAPAEEQVRNMKPHFLRASGVKTKTKQPQSWDDIDEITANIAFLFLVLFAILAVSDSLSLWALVSGLGVFLAVAMVIACFQHIRSKRQET